MKITTNDVAGYCDMTFEAGQRALQCGDLEGFRLHAGHHQAYAELFFHLKNGGRVH